MPKLFALQAAALSCLILLAVNPPYICDVRLDTVAPILTLKGGGNNSPITLHATEPVRWAKDTSDNPVATSLTLTNCRLVRIETIGPCDWRITVQATRHFCYMTVAIKQGTCADSCGNVNAGIAWSKLAL